MAVNRVGHCFLCTIITDGIQVFHKNMPKAQRGGNYLYMTTYVYATRIAHFFSAARCTISPHFLRKSV